MCDTRLNECIVHTSILINHIRKCAKDDADFDALLFASMAAMFRYINDKKKFFAVAYDYLKEDK